MSVCQVRRELLDVCGIVFMSSSPLKVDRLKQDITLSGTGMSGWAGMAHTFRTMDEEKIRDCKEDIDTLLVFVRTILRAFCPRLTQHILQAGLFSAVLTAFLVESYNTLSPDKTDTVIALLAQIASRTNSYTSDSNIPNSAVPSSTSILPSFEPTASSLRVNTLWFTSLNLSLITASFGIMVKQWLRSYLAMPYISPQARLRARRFRFSGFDKWKVFEIAAMLPLLLQLALGLFLVGLCFFTWSVHPNIGKTSVPLVAGWAFLFSMAVVAPAFSARCPYKTAFLERALTALRHLLRSYGFFRAFAHTLRQFRRCTSSQSQACGPPSEIDDVLSEEEDAVKDEASDIQFLAQTDEIMQDDVLLESSILESVRQLALGPYETMQFVAQCLRHRIKQQAFGGTQLSGPLDLSRLSRRCWKALTGISADIIVQHLSRPESRDIPAEGSWFDSAVVILFSVSPYGALSAQGTKAITLLLQNLDACKCVYRISSHFHSDSDSLVHFMTRMRQTLSQFMNDGTKFAQALLNIIQGFMCTEFCTHDTTSTYAAFMAHAGSAPRDLMATLYGIVVLCVRHRLQGDVWLFSHQVCLRILLSSGHVSSALGLRAEVIQVLTAVYTSPRLCYYPLGMLVFSDDTVYGMPRADTEEEFKLIRALFTEMVSSGKQMHESQTDIKYLLLPPGL